MHSSYFDKYPILWESHLVLNFKFSNDFPTILRKYVKFYIKNSFKKWDLLQCSFKENEDFIIIFHLPIGDHNAIAFTPSFPLRKLIIYQNLFELPETHRQAIIDHEIGHILGYRHEDALIKNETNLLKITHYRPNSIMHSDVLDGDNIREEDILILKEKYKDLTIPRLDKIKINGGTVTINAIDFQKRINQDAVFKDSGECFYYICENQGFWLNNGYTTITTDQVNKIIEIRSHLNIFCETKKNLIYLDLKMYSERRISSIAIVTDLVPIPFILDTGSTISQISKEIVKKHNLKIEKIRYGDTIYDTVDLKLSINSENRTFIVKDMSLLGMDILRYFDFYFERGRIKECNFDENYYEASIF